MLAANHFGHLALDSRIRVGRRRPDVPGGGHHLDADAIRVVLWS
jgi:hypothetical protein